MKLPGLAATGLVLAACVFIDPANAETCDALERKLAALPAGGHVLPDRASEETSSIAGEHSRLMQIEAKIRQADCGNRTAADANPCTQLYAERRTKQADLAELEALQVAVTSRRNELDAQMRDAKCSQAASFRQTVATATGGQGSILHLGVAQPTSPRPAGHSGFSVVAGSYPSFELEASANRVLPDAIAAASARDNSTIETSVRRRGLDNASVSRIERTTLAEPDTDETGTARPSPVETAAERPERRVRVVGPKFLPDPEAAIDLQVQVRDRVR